jgi:protein TonB
MNRTQKKCLIASAAFHGSLVLLLIFGAALMPEDRPSPSNRITFFDPSKVTDGPTQGGGSESAVVQPPAPVVPPQPPVSQPVLPPQPQPQPTPQPRPVVKQQDDFKPAPTPKPDAEAFKPVKPKPVDQDEFKPVDHPPVKQVASNDTAADAKARTAAENQRRIASQISRGIGRLSSSLSKDTAVQISSGSDGGEAAAKYSDIVESTYHAAWIGNRPASLVGDSATVLVSVTIGRDGRVIRHEITKPSGNPVMDRSIENTLEIVTDIAPFPAGSKDVERSYTITFNLSAK